MLHFNLKFNIDIRSASCIKIKAHYLGFELKPQTSQRLSNSINHIKVIQICSKINIKLTHTISCFCLHSLNLFIKCLAPIFQFLRNSIWICHPKIFKNLPRSSMVSYHP
ncbi:hypothetical protein BATDEDRAFT_88077 [Batrachochytrium dendrobatidis JAM81]|uniref:Uncharacterized protein n=1 Tax=Batrachochytrium dendrobatidis (strain JAM81 / FGSC 10211) TaxID=684364 RepID=F4P1V5_BATDJ|nr:uncharacterized protein BATDEDRAFT_88077 [Batrachochytrium dendrobatidis JAM81]EGF80749.1 hypothetical protein BATDEDRAFT_88077 [Batrachochytrium dendrobatidis JAM81]|eukprot:XP_006678679.1 hypothetical protein BATDEDRAFT_88077 [Batrachochytrium dendrobatidis JAM81]